MASQARVDLAQHRIGQPLVADRHHRVQAMGPGLERLALDGGEGEHHGVPGMRR